MFYRYEYFPKQDSIAIHLTERLTEDIYITDPSNATEPRIAELFHLIRASKGVTTVSIAPFTIHLEFGKCYSKDEVANEVIELLKLWCMMHELTLPDEQWIKQLTIRTDIACIQCPECQALQDAAMREAMEDFSRYD